MKSDTDSAGAVVAARSGRPSTPPSPAAARAPAGTWDAAVSRKELLRQLADNADAYPNELERQFPHVLARIAALWGAPEMDAYFASLLFSDRRGREGFPPAVAMEISRLAEVHGALRLARSSAVGGWNTFTDGDAERWKKLG